MLGVEEISRGEGGFRGRGGEGLPEREEGNLDGFHIRVTLEMPVEEVELEEGHF